MHRITLLLLLTLSICATTFGQKNNNIYSNFEMEFKSCLEDIFHLIHSADLESKINDRESNNPFPHN